MIDRILRKLQIKHKLIMLNLFITGIVVLVAAVILIIVEFISSRDSLFMILWPRQK